MRPAFSRPHLGNPRKLFKSRSRVLLARHATSSAHRVTRRSSRACRPLTVPASAALKACQGRAPLLSASRVAQLAGSMCLFVASRAQEVTARIGHDASLLSAAYVDDGKLQSRHDVLGFLLAASSTFRAVPLEVQSLAYAGWCAGLACAGCCCWRRTCATSKPLRLTFVVDARGSAARLLNSSEECT